MSDIGKYTVECMADEFMQDYQREYAAYGRQVSDKDVPIILSAILKELRGLRADLDAVRAGGIVRVAPTATLD